MCMDKTDIKFNVVLDDYRRTKMASTGRVKQPDMKTKFKNKTNSFLTDYMAVRRDNVLIQQYFHIKQNRRGVPAWRFVTSSSSPTPTVLDACVVFEHHREWHRGSRVTNRDSSTLCHRPPPQFSSPIINVLIRRDLQEPAFFK